MTEGRLGNGTYSLQMKGLAICKSFLSGILSQSQVDRTFNSRTKGKIHWKERNLGSVTHWSVNFWKLYKANNSNVEQKVATPSRASSVTFVHCSLKTFKHGHPLATASTPLLWMNSESIDKTSRYLQWDPTASKATSVILTQAAMLKDLRDLRHPLANAPNPESVKPSQNRRFKSSSNLQDSPIAARPKSPT